LISVSQSRQSLPFAKEILFVAYLKTASPSYVSSKTGPTVPTLRF
jgi:hypothetical protein